MHVILFKWHFGSVLGPILGPIFGPKNPIEMPPSCSELFKPVITDEGQCCTFNTQPPAAMFRNTEPEVGGAQNCAARLGAISV